MLLKLWNTGNRDRFKIVKSCREDRSIYALDDPILGVNPRLVGKSMLA